MQDPTGRTERKTGWGERKKNRDRREKEMQELSGRRPNVSREWGKD